MLTPITRGEKVDICISATKELFRNQFESDLYLRIYGEELDMLLMRAQEDNNEIVNYKTLTWNKKQS